MSCLVYISYTIMFVLGTKKRTDDLCFIANSVSALASKIIVQRVEETAAENTSKVLPMEETQKKRQPFNVTHIKETTVERSFVADVH